MAIESGYNKPNFPDGEDEAIEYFIQIIKDKAPKHKIFELHKIKEELNLSDLEKEQFNYLMTDIRTSLVDQEIVVVKLGSSLRLNSKYNNQKPFSNQNIIIGDNYGFQSSESDLRKAAINKTKAAPIIKPDKKSSLQNISSFLKHPLVVASLIIIIEEITLGRIWKFIYSYFFSVK